MKTKECSKCGSRKTVAHFYADSKSVDGYQSQCDSCKEIRTDRHADKAIAHFPEMVRAKSDHETVAGLPMGSVVKIDHRRVLIEKVKVRKPGDELVTLKVLNSEGERLDWRFKPLILNKNVFIDALRHNGKIRVAA